MIPQAVADDAAAAGQAADHARRHARLLEDLDQLDARQRRLGRRLADHGVARHQRGRDGRAQQRVGKVPRRDDGPDAVRAQHAGVRVGGDQPPHLADVAVVRAHLGGVVRVEIGGLLDLAQRLDAVLPHLEDEPGRELEAPLAHDVGGALDDRGALLPRDGAPARKRRARGGDCVAHVGVGGGRDARHDDARVRRAAALDRRGAGARVARDVQRIAAPERAAHLGDRRFERGVERRIIRAEADVCHFLGRAHDVFPRIE